MAETIPAPLQGKVAVVTGGSRGIGKGIAQTFARHGCTHIAITYATNRAAAKEVLDSIKATNSEIQTAAIQADLHDKAFGHNVVAQALQALQTDHIDIMVSNAAYLDTEKWPHIADCTWETWNDIVTSTAWAPLTLAQAVIKHMPKGGRIIMISSGSSKIPGQEPTIPYGAGKAALDSLTRSLGALWGAQFGVTVNSISVGATATDALMAGVEKWGPEFRKLIEAFSPLKRIGEVHEVAEIVAFVASPQASWIIGNQIPANGGGLSVLQG